MFTAMTESLLERTIRLTKESGIPLVQICRDTGLGRRWMHKLLAGQLTDPGVNKIERLHNYLTAKQDGAAA